MSVQTVEQLATYGPATCEAMSEPEARAWCRRLTKKHYENFSVLSSVVPAHQRDDFAAVYAFCRWADDLSDEMDTPEQATEHLRWWREELNQCFDDQPRHPVFVALRPTIQQHNLPKQPFADLISAFEQDQIKTRYETWDELIDYCRGSANPVGRLVLMLMGEPREEALFELSDATCTALQLTNHWQDTKRDLLERDRIYIPKELNKIERFEERFRASAKQGYGVDQQFLGDTREVLQTCVNRTWPLFEKGHALLEQVSGSTRPIVWLLSFGGQHVLRLIEMWNYETVLHRPKLGAATRFRLLAKAWFMARRSGGKRAA